jgi:5-formyltetrahydrofolate cyclo-ligase
VITAQKKQLRQHFRLKRKKISKAKQTVEAIKLYRFLNQRWLKGIKNQRIAMYVATQSELDLSRVARFLKANNNTIFLPIVEQLDAPLIFCQAPVLNWALLPKKAFNIPEPKGCRKYFVAQMDIVFVPLLAFDKSVNRLGMGGGFYDRTLAQTTYKNANQSPFLIGVGYDFQQHSNYLPTEKTDFRLDAVVTPSKLLVDS